MAKAPQRISVVRIPRQVVNQTLSTEFHDYTDKDTSTTYLTVTNLPRIDEPSSKTKKQKEVPRAKTDLFSPTIPPATDSRNDILNQQSEHFEQSRPSTVVQHQPVRVDTWVKFSTDSAHQPNLSWKATSKWSNDLCSLFSDFNMCCYACACWCCFRHEISTMMNEHWILWFINCTPLMELRTKFRQQYSIQGSIAEDCCLSTFCPLCVALQIANEGRHYGHRIFT